MKSPASFAALALALLLSGCGASTTNTTVNTTNSAGNSTSTATSNASNTASVSNSSNTTVNSNAEGSASTESSGPKPMDQIDPAAKIENGKTVNLEDITLTLPADWKKGPNQNVHEFLGKTKDGKPLRLVVYWSPADDEYKGLSTPEAAIKYMKQIRTMAEENPDRYSLPRILKLVDDRVGMAYDSKSPSPDGPDEWVWLTWDSADFEKGFSFQYPTGTFDQHKSLRDGIINSVKFKRGPRMPSM